MLFHVENDCENRGGILGMHCDMQSCSIVVKLIPALAAAGGFCVVAYCCC